MQRPANSGRWRCLLISDLHLAPTDGASYFPKAAGEAALNRGLQSVIERERPHQLFILGDVFHMPGRLTPMDGAYDMWCGGAMSKIVEVAASEGVNEIYAMGGNHDRALFAHRGAQWQAAGGGRLAVFSSVNSPLMLELVSTCGHASCFLTHDGGNALWLGPAEVEPFLRGLRQANNLPDSAWLVTGHTHRAVDLTTLPRELACKVASLGCFTACSKHSCGLDYGMVTEDDTQGFVFRADNGPRIW